MRRVRRGFSLVEVLMALALMALVLVGVVGVMRVMAGGMGPGVERPAAHRDAAVRRALEAVETDLLNARYVLPGGVEGGGVMGYLSRDGAGPTLGRRSIEPARVRYEVERRGGRAWLVRLESVVSGYPVSVPDGPRVKRTLLLAGIESWSLDYAEGVAGEASAELRGTMAGDDGVDRGVDPLRAAVRGARRVYPGARVRVSLELSDGGAFERFVLIGGGR